MARIVENPDAKTSAPASGADDLSIIHPDITETVAGRSITVREFGFVEGLEVRRLCAGFIKDLNALASAGSELLIEDVLDAVSNHLDAIRQAIAKSTGADREWIDGLNDKDGYTLFYLWWIVNGPFFVRPEINRRNERAYRELVKVGAGQTSMPNSPQPDTETPRNSGDTPSDS